MAKRWSRGAMWCTSTRPRYTSMPGRLHTVSGASPRPGTGEAASLRSSCPRLFPSIALLTHHDSPHQTGGVLRTADDPPPVWRGTMSRAQPLTYAIALHGGLVQGEPQAGPLGSDEAAILQRWHAL